MEENSRLLVNVLDGTDGVRKNTSLLLVVAAFGCFAISVWGMSPGWLTTDSLSHYVDAKQGVYRDMSPILLTWLWNKLLVFSDGPLPMLVLQLLAYWGGFYFLSEAARTRVGPAAPLILLCGFWPGIFEQVGFIWKDIIFGTMMLLAWSMLVAAYFQQRYLRTWEKVVLVAALIISVGVKQNGITAVPFVFGAWFYLEGKFRKSFIRISAAAVAATVAVTAFSIVLTMPSKIVRQGNLIWQYTQIYDLLAISVAENTVFLPKHITDQRTGQLSELRKYYWPGGMNSFFFHKGGTLGSTDPVEIDALRKAWLSAVIAYPKDYLAHRWDNLSVMLRLGAYTPAWVGEPGIWENSYIPPFKETTLSEALGATLKTMPWAYLPWMYVVLAGVSFLFSMLFAKNRAIPLLLFASSAAFFAPHFFVLPAADYRYLYFCYLMAMVAAVIALIDFVSRLKRPSPTGASY